MPRPSGWALRGGIAICLLALPGTGCSFLLVRGPPPEAHEMTNFRCTSTPEAPAVDIVLAGVGGLATLLSLALSGLSDTGDKRGQVALIGLPLFVLPAGSATYGFAMVSRCRRARADLAARSLLAPPQMAAAPTPAPVTPPPGAMWRAATLKAAVAIHSAPFSVAPVVSTFAAGARLLVSIELRDGWRRVALPGGGFGYLPDAVLTIDDGPPP